LTTRTAKAWNFFRLIGVVAAAMGIIAFALGYITHPMM
jgi:hypothetical protein